VNYISTINGPTRKIMTLNIKCVGRVGGFCVKPCAHKVNIMVYFPSFFIIHTHSAEITDAVRKYSAVHDEWN
jgi:hypothetical protein